MLERAGFLSSSLVFFAEKGALALHGLPPRLVNLGFVYPPLSFLLQLAFPTPLIGQAVIERRARGLNKRPRQCRRG